MCRHFSIWMPQLASLVSINVGFKVPSCDFGGYRLSLLKNSQWKVGSATMESALLAGESILPVRLAVAGRGFASPVAR